MGVFVVATTREDNDQLLAESISTNFPSDHYDIGRGQWLISYKGTAQSLFNILAPDNKLDPQVKARGIVVFGILGYYGVASRDMWEWIKTKLENEIA